MNIIGRWGLLALGILLLLGNFIGPAIGFEVSRIGLQTGFGLILGGGLIAWGSKRFTKKWYIQAVKEGSNTIYGPFKDPQEGDLFTRGVDCTERNAFQDKPSNRKDAIS